MKNTPKTITIDNEIYIRQSDTKAAPTATGPESIVRTVNSGVHIGTVTSRNGTEVVVSNARILWSWEGAFTLNEISVNGVDRKTSRISKPVPQVLLLDACCIYPLCDGVDLSTTEK